MVNEKHEFKGRLDRPCEICSKPDRDEIHISFTPQQRSYDAVKQVSGQLIELGRGGTNGSNHSKR